MIDFKGNGLWFEVTGSTREELNKRAEPYKPGKACVFENLVFKSSHWVSGGTFVDLNPSRQLRYTPVPSAHRWKDLFTRGAAEPSCPLDKCVLAENYARADVRGLVVEIGAVKTDVGVNKNRKAEVWIKDESEVHLLVELWGKTFVDMVERGELQVGSVLQVDNGSLRRNSDGKVYMSAEYYGDDLKATAFIFRDPLGPRTATLMGLDRKSGTRISSNWAPSTTGQGFVPLSPRAESFAACLATVKTCSAPWSPTEPLGPGANPTALPEEVHITLWGVWLAEVQNESPFYKPCEVCHTKIDPESGLCRKRRDGGACTTTPAAEFVVLANVRLADFSGSCADILVDGEALRGLAGFESIKDLYDQIENHGVESLTYRCKCDIRIGANRIARNGKRGSADPKCNFQVLSVDHCVLAPWNSTERPAVQKILCAANDRSSGHVVPIASVADGMLQTPMGAQYAAASIVPDLISLLCVVIESPDVEEAEHGFSVVHKHAHSVCAPEPSFHLEAFCRLAELPVYKMEDGAPRLVLGRVRFEDGKPVVMAERMLAVPFDENEAKVLFEAEVVGTLELLTKHVETPSGSPNAQWLINETPAKRRCRHPLGGA